MSSGSDDVKTQTIFYSGEIASEAIKGKKNDQEKAPITLIPREHIEGTAQAFAYGAGKYGRFNFTKGIEISRTLDAAMRHLLAFAEREDLDPESKLNHLYHASASIAMTLYNLKNHPELDDRLRKD